MLTTSSFSVSQMLQMILPTIIALFLFTPFVEEPSHRIDATTLVLTGIVLGYLISDMVREIAKQVIKAIPGFRKRLKEYEKRADLVDSNWRLRYLQAQLSKDDREAIDIVGHYMIFTQLLCFYLMAYLVFNVVLLICKLTSVQSATGGGTNAFSAARLLGTLKSVNTPVFGGWQVLTIVVIPVSLLVTVSLLYDYLKKYKQLFLPRGLYDTHAEKYQRATGNIANSVWGRVMRKGQKDGKDVDYAVPDLGVWLVKTGEPKVGPSKTDAQGYFQFKDAFAICREGCRTLELDKSYSMGKPTKDYSVNVLSTSSLAVILNDEKAVPFFPVTVTLADKNSLEGQNKGSAGGGA